MRKEKIKKYIGKKVIITFFDGETREGTLMPFNREVCEEVFEYNNWFCLVEEALNFLPSHIFSISLKEENDEKNR